MIGYLQPESEPIDKTNRVVKICRRLEEIEDMFRTEEGRPEWEIQDLQEEQYGLEEELKALQPAVNAPQVPDNWLPTPENINALPDAVRGYIHDLVANADPAGMVRENILVRDENAMLRALVSEQQRVAQVPTPTQISEFIAEGGKQSLSTYDLAWQLHDWLAATPSVAQPTAAQVPDELKEFLEAKIHHLPVMDQHALTDLLAATPSVEEKRECCCGEPDDAWKLCP